MTYQETQNISDTVDNQAFKLSWCEPHIVLITIDVPNERVNTLKPQFAEQVRQVIAQARQDRQLAGMIFISGKTDNFIAGADIKMLDACESAEQAETIALTGQQVMAEIEALPFPVVAAIHGSCLGGGLEFALACQRRICSDSESTRFGLPEVQLGLLPGSGGSQRLPQLIGLNNALPLILTGKTLRPKQAKKVGLVDAVVSEDILLEVALAQVKQGRKGKQPESARQRVMQQPWIQSLMMQYARKQAMAKSGGHYPAVEQIINLLSASKGKASPEGYQAEARAFGHLVFTSQSAALRRLFFLSTQFKKRSSDETPLSTLKSVAVLGGGLMGGGIATVSAYKAGLPVRIKDISAQGVATAIRHYQQFLAERIAKKQLSPRAKPRLLTRITADTQWRGFYHSDIVIEAVFEDLAVKQQMVAEVEKQCSPKTIFASNTSSLSIAKIAEAAQRPENIIGLHYFSPVEKMPLVEVIPHSGTSQTTLSSALSFAKQQQKIPIVVKDSPGFYVNRILTPYLNEAMLCLLEGEPIEHIDHALKNFGFPLGPFQLMDEVGLDVASKISPILAAAYGERFEPPAAFQRLIEQGRKGKKNCQGFYQYTNKRWLKQPRQVDKTVYAILGIEAKKQQSAEEIVQRCLLMMLNEAARCLEEGVIDSTAAGDIGAVFGIGFPANLGGPFNYLEQLGEAEFHAQLKRLEAKFGQRFTPYREA